MGFSVLMSVYYKEKPEYLQEALQSVINQTLPPTEIVLVEDGKLTPELDKAIEEFRVAVAGQVSTRLKFVKLQENVKLGRALAEGLKHCDNELVARMDTDDLAVEDRFNVQYRYMTENPNVSVSGGLMEEFDPQDDSYRKIKHMPIDKADIIS